MNEHDPIELFRDWRRDASVKSTLAHPDAMCVSTVDASGTPHARFVDLKNVQADGFVFCTSYRSPKGRQIEQRPQVSLTFWWDHVGRQVRVLGLAARISSTEADRWFAKRSNDAQLATLAFDQSEPVDAAELQERLRAARANLGAHPVGRPEHWGGYLVKPNRMEFLQFVEDRLHRRLLYELHGSKWSGSILQP